MSRIRDIVRHDLRAVFSNVMTMMVLFGVAVVPLVFSAFNTLASWDPFDNASRLKIAVASKDEGYNTDLAKMRLNLGDQVLAQLSVNKDIDWVLTSPDEAVEGTKSGEYYASIVLPPTFSTDLLTFYAVGAEPATIEMVTNQKKNTLGPVVTSQAANAAVTQINTSFSQVVNNVGLGLVDNLSEFLNSGDTRAALDRMSARVAGVSDQLRASAGTVDALNGLVGSSIPLVTSADEMLSAADGSGSGSDSGRSGAPGSGSDGSGDASAISDISRIFQDATASLPAALDKTASNYAAVGDKVDALFANADSTSASSAATLRELAGKVDQQVKGFEGVRSTLERQVGPAIGAPGVVSRALQPGYESTLRSVDSAISRSSDMRDALNSAADDLESGTSNAAESRERSKAAIGRAREAVASAKDSYEQDLRPQLRGLGSTLRTLRDDLGDVRDAVGRARDTLGTGGVGGDLGRIQDATRALADKLRTHADDAAELEKAIKDAGRTGDFAKLAALVGKDPEGLAAKLASPVAVNRQPVDPVVSFGAGMAPLYAILSLWIGALITAVVVRAKPTDEVLAKLAAARAERSEADGSGDDAELGGDSEPGAESDDSGVPEAVAHEVGSADETVPSEASEPGQESEPDAGDAPGEPEDDAAPGEPEDENYGFSRSQLYFGRYGFFATMGLLQSTLVTLGLIVFVGVSPVHPSLLILAGWVISLVFMLIVYTLVLSFGNAGKALSVLLLIVQISGSGGAYPLVVLPQWFQNISPWLPATYAIDAFRSALAGIHHGDYWIHLLKLLLFVLPALLLGLVLRKGLDGYNQKMDAAMEKTRLM